MGLHPLVCSLIAEPHPLHEVIGCVRTPTEDTTEKKRRDTELKKGQHAFFPTLSLSSNSNMLPSIYVRNGVLLLCLYLVQEGGEDPPGLSQLIAGTGRRGIFSSKNWTWNQKHGSTRKCFSAYYNQPADKMHLVPAEDIQDQPFIGIWELHILEEDCGCK